MRRDEFFDDLNEYWLDVLPSGGCRHRRARVPLSAASPVPRNPPAGPGDEAPRCRLPTAGLLANGGNSGIVLLLPGEADGGLSAIGWHLDVGRCQSRRRPPSRTINQSSRGRNSEHLWAGTWSPVMLVKMGPEGTGGDTGVTLPPTFSPRLLRGPAIPLWDAMRRRRTSASFPSREHRV